MILHDDSGVHSLLVTLANWKTKNIVTSNAFIMWEKTYFVGIKKTLQKIWRRSNFTRWMVRFVICHIALVKYGLRKIVKMFVVMHLSLVHWTKLKK